MLGVLGAHTFKSVRAVTICKISISPEMSMFAEQIKKNVGWGGWGVIEIDMGTFKICLTICQYIWARH